MTYCRIEPEAVAAYHRRMLRHYRIRLLLLRGAMLSAFTLFTAWMLMADAAQVRQGAIASVILCWLLASLPLIITEGQWPEWSRNLRWQVWLDVLLLSIMFYFSGGYANPLLSFYLFPILIAGLILPRRQAWMIGMLVIASYTLLIRFYQPLPMMHGMPPGFHLHLLGMWLTFVMVVIILLAVVVRMSDERRRHEAQLADMRQRAIRHHHMLALGAQAASDAHELGTPVNSMLLLLEQWREEMPEAHELQAQMSAQLERCRHILHRLSRRARAMNSHHGLNADVLAGEVLQRWSNLCPNIHLDSVMLPPQPYPALTRDVPLEEALWILLDNAREAGARHIRVQLAQQGRGLRLEVSDDGCGFPDEVLAQTGKQPLSGRPQGKGLGLYLLHYMLEHVGGSMVARNHSAGAQVICILPLQVNT